MSRTRREYFKRKLRYAFLHSDSEEFFAMIWAVRALQSGRAGQAKQFLSFPDEAAVEDHSSRFYVHPWQMETLINEFLATTSSPFTRKSFNIKTNCRAFGTAAYLANILGQIEDAESALFLPTGNIFEEMGRLAQRQFEWQRGFFNLSRFYLTAFLYNGTLTKAAYEKQYGYSIEEFCAFCFACFAVTQNNPGMLCNADLSLIGIDVQKQLKMINTVSLTVSEARNLAFRLRSDENSTAYRKSVLRTFPAIRYESDPRRIVLPIPELIILRSTAGLFYDVVKLESHADIRNEVASRFESYASELIHTMMNRYNVEQEFPYRFSGRSFRSPDITISHEGSLKIVAECKAVRMTYEAKFDQSATVNAIAGYKELAKGVLQIWRFVAHHRLAALPKTFLLDRAITGIIITLDTWLSMSPHRKAVLEMADALSKQDAFIEEQDRIPIVFTPMEDLELLLSEAAPDAVIATAASAARDPKYAGWFLWNVHREMFPDSTFKNDYPFREKLQEVSPFWRGFDTDLGLQNPARRSET